MNQSYGILGEFVTQGQYDNNDSLIGHEPISFLLQRRLLVELIDLTYRRAQQEAVGIGM